MGQGLNDFDGFKQLCEKFGSRYLSGDNCQPFEFRWQGTELQIYHRQDLAEHKLNFKNWASLISLGSIIANLQVFAHLENLKLEWQFFESNFVGSGLWTNLKFTAEASASSQLPGALLQLDKEKLMSCLLQRKTVRDPLATLSEDLEQKINRDAQEFFTHAIWIENKKIRQMLPTFLQIDSLFFLDKEIFEPTMSWVRFSKKTYYQLRDGLYRKDMGLRLSEQLVTFLMGKFPYFFARLLRLGFFKAALRVNKAQYQNCHGVYFISAASMTNLDIIMVGRQATLFFVYLWSLGVASQPCSLLALFARDNWHGKPQRYFLENKTTQNMLNFLRDNNMPGEPLWAFRIGQVKKTYEATLKRKW